MNITTNIEEQISRIILEDGQSSQYGVQYLNCDSAETHTKMFNSKEEAVKIFLACSELLMICSPSVLSNNGFIYDHLFLLKKDFVNHRLTPIDEFPDLNRDLSELT